jgi:spore coat protein U-like protein
MATMKNQTRPTAGRGMATRWALVLAGIGAMAAAAPILTPGSAIAATAPATIGITSTVQATCLNAVTPLAFGTYTGAILHAAATVTVTCTNTTTYTVGLDPGVTAGATVTTRQMKNATFLLNYGLFTDAAWTINWGNIGGAGGWVSGTGTGSAQVLTVYGQIVAGQYVTPGAYADTITATVTY